MTHKNENYRAATTEVCSLYVDLNKRKVTEFELLKKQKINDFIQENKINFEEKDLKLLSKLKK
jgi:acyl-CoA thioester hydrolase